VQLIIVKANVKGSAQDYFLNHAQGWSGGSGGRKVRRLFTGGGKPSESPEASGARERGL